MNKAKLIEQSNELHRRLEKARRMEDYDSAQLICGELQHVNRQLHLIEIQAKEETAGNIV